MVVCNFICAPPKNKNKNKNNILQGLSAWLEQREVILFDYQRSEYFRGTNLQTLQMRSVSQLQARSPDYQIICLVFLFLFFFLFYFYQDQADAS